MVSTKITAGVKRWAGIGSRVIQVPQIIIDQEYVGRRLTEMGWGFSSGNAEQSDENFHRGVASVDPKKAKIILPWKGFRVKDIPYKQRRSIFVHPDEEAFQQAREFMIKNKIIEDFDSLKQSHQRLHARNVFQIYTEGLDQDPVDEVIYYAPEDRWGNVAGGTRTGVAIARLLGIPTTNMKIPRQHRRLMRRLK